MPASHIILCGLAGAGKSTVGAQLARRLGRPFIDLDHAIEREAGASVREIFAREGEPAFRARERAMFVTTLAAPIPSVISLGGGTLDHDATLAEALAHTLVYLDAPVRSLVPRVGGSDRPLLAGDAAARLAELAEKRTPRYSQAHVRVDASRSPGAVVAAICASLAERGDVTAVRT